MKSWSQLTKEQIKERVFEALQHNVSFFTGNIMGIPCSYLDKNVFDHQAAQDAPFLKAMVENPNHIGCHTFGHSEEFFRGTQQLEIEAVAICAENIFGAEEGSYDGYIAAGGTEGNIQALWVFRNFLRKEYGDKNSQIGVLFSKDTHYSVQKGINLLDIEALELEVDENRTIKPEFLRQTIRNAKDKGIKHFIFVANMGTTMFGTVDDVEMVSAILDEEKVYYKIHIDAAFGGFVVPFLDTNNKLNFKNEKIMSISMDAHKMLQAPYGTGIFMIRKGLMQYAATGNATYVSGGDCTLSGSRSGANAVAVWMLLNAYGYKGLKRKNDLAKALTEELCAELEYRDVKFIHNPYCNIVTIHKDYITQHIQETYHLVPDNHTNPEWWKVVVMAHVGHELIEHFVEF